MTRRISPLGLSLAYIGDKTVTPTGAVASANANAVGTSTLTFGRVTQLGPLVLPGRIRTISAQEAGVSIVLVGAAGTGQSEELEGSSVTVYLDGARALGRASIIDLSLAEFRGANKRRYLKDREQRIIIEIDGEFIEVASQEEAEEIFNEIRKQRRIEARKAKMKRASIRKITFDILERSRNK